jgi:Na+/H+ antiporter NhaC
MALSEREQAMLEEMERNLMSQDAGFANRVKSVSSSNKSASKLIVGVLVLLAGLILLVLAVVLQVAFFGVAAFIVMVIGIIIASSNFRLPEIPKVGGSGNKGTFFEDRWNQRFNKD